MKNYLIYDLGTGNSRVALVNSEDEIISVRNVENKYYVDYKYEDAQYFKPDEWKQKLFDATMEILKENAGIKIDAISAAGARQSIVVLDNKLKAIYGLPNIDNRGRKWVKKISGSEEIYERTGKWLTEDFPAAKLLGLKKGRREIYDKAYSFTSLSEWVGLIFTGRLCMEPSQACETQLYDIASHAWSDNLIEKYDLGDILMPETIRGGKILGKVLDEVKCLLGIDYELDFVIGGADTQVAMIGADIKEGDICIVSGTTSPVVYLSDKRFYDEEERCWVDCFIGNNDYVIETNPGVSGLNYQIIKNLFFDDITYEEMEKQFKKIKNIKMIARLTSLDFENKSGYKSGGFLLKPPLKVNLKKIDIAWSVVADIACAIIYQYENLSNLLNIKETYLLGCGGGFQSKTLCQYIADLSGLELRIPKGFSQATVLGLVKLLDNFYGVKRSDKLNEFIIYKPQENDLIKQYYKEWLKMKN